MSDLLFNYRLMEIYGSILVLVTLILMIVMLMLMLMKAEFLHLELLVLNGCLFCYLCVVMIMIDVFDNKTLSVLHFLFHYHYHSRQHMDGSESVVPNQYDLVTCVLVKTGILT